MYFSNNESYWHYWNILTLYLLLVWYYTFGVFGVVGRRLGPLAIVGVVRPLGVGVVRPVGVWRPDLVGVAFGVEDSRGVDSDDLGGVGVVDRPNAVDGVGVVERPKGWRGLIYRGVPVLVEGVRGFVGVMFDDELLRRFERDKLPDEPKSGCFRNEFTNLLFEFPDRFTIEVVICLLRLSELSPELPADDIDDA